MTSKSVAEKASSFYIEPMILIFYDLFFVFGVTFLFDGTFKIVRNLPDRSCEICLSDFVAPIHHQKICQHLSQQRSIRSVTKENVWSVRVQDPWQPLTASIKTWRVTNWRSFGRLPEMSRRTILMLPNGSLGRVKSCASSKRTFSVTAG